MRELIVKQFAFPKNTVINRHIPKKAFFEHGELTKVEMNLFISDIDGIYLLSVMKPDQLNIAPYKIEDIYYAEVFWVYVHLREEKNVQRILKSIHRLFPNPTVIILGGEQYFISMSTAHKRLHKINQTKVVLEEMLVTDWFQLNHLTDHYSRLLSNLLIDNLTKEDLYQFYDDIHQWIKVEPVISWIGRLPEKHNRLEAVLIVDQIIALKNKIKAINKEEKSKVNFGDKMEIHIKKKQTEHQINKYMKQLKELC